MSAMVYASKKPASAPRTESGFRGFFRRLSLSKKDVSPSSLSSLWLPVQIHLLTLHCLQQSSSQREEVAPPPPYNVVPSSTRPVHVGERGARTRPTGLKDRHTPPATVPIAPNSTTSVPLTRPSQPDMTPEEKEKRRTRRLSKPAPPTHAPPQTSSTTSLNPNVYSSNSKTLGSSRTSISSFFHHSNSATTLTATSRMNVDSSGRTRPPVSGTPARNRLGGYRHHTSPAPHNTAHHNAPSIGHAYHYKRTRSNSSTDLSRLHEAVSCLEAVLDAYDANLVTDVRHVVEQVALARDILAGEDCAGSGSASTAFMMKSAKASQLTVDSVDLPPPP